MGWKKGLGKSLTKDKLACLLPSCCSNRIEIEVHADCGSGANVGKFGRGFYLRHNITSVNYLKAQLSKEFRGSLCQQINPLQIMRPGLVN